MLHCITARSWEAIRTLKFVELRFEICRLGGFRPRKFLVWNSFFARFRSQMIQTSCASLCVNHRFQIFIKINLIFVSGALEVVITNALNNYRFRRWISALTHRTRASSLDVSVSMYCSWWQDRVISTWLSINEGSETFGFGFQNPEDKKRISDSESAWSNPLGTKFRIITQKKFPGFPRYLFIFSSIKYLNNDCARV